VCLKVAVIGGGDACEIVLITDISRQGRRTAYFPTTTIMKLSFTMFCGLPDFGSNRAVAK
jgi:hypothetical protein